MFKEADNRMHSDRIQCYKRQTIEYTLTVYNVTIGRQYTMTVYNKRQTIEYTLTVYTVTRGRQ